jgi:hypothetical protein
MKRFGLKKERKLQRKARNIDRKLEWDEAVNVLTCALTTAIWREGGTREDAIATADIVHQAVCRDLAAWFDGARPTGEPTVVPFRRKRSYLR